MPLYVQRIDGQIAAVFPEPRPDWSPPTEPHPLADDNPELLAFLDTPTLVPRVLAPLEFIGRLNETEQQRLHQTAITNAMVHRWLWGVLAAQQVNLDDPVTMTVLDALTANGVLSAEHRAALLAVPPVDEANRSSGR